MTQRENETRTITIAHFFFFSHAHAWYASLSRAQGDEAGLGRTVQCIALVAHLQDRGASGPVLVTVPASALCHCECTAVQVPPAMMGRKARLFLSLIHCTASSTKRSGAERRSKTNRFFFFIQHLYDGIDHESRIFLACHACCRKSVLSILHIQHARSIGQFC